ncbi:hypothetical protein SLEP1_g48918 [Rubroshorea leprosula]|uniref:Uncharacterized protein n=1 Tax=Rubroshorea leprosula TaxID=152421 RepID=A0AAV5LV28_9ROSI|nr:hypothetical protein SLEP1_g48918 [Rubroshorea leprosula]
MSSERTQSIVGSEVEPLDYGRMDTESSPSPTSSEETVEGVRGDEVVEVGGGEVVEVGGNEVMGVGVDSIPIIVVKVEGNGERGYDRNAEIVEEVKQYRSELRTRDDLWDAEVRALASWKAKRANQNKFSLTEDEEEEVGRLVRKRGDVLNIMDLTSAACIEAAELYGPSALSEADMNQFLNTVGGKAIPKKPRKKSRTLPKQVDEGRTGKEVVPTASAETGEEVPPLKRKGWEERKALEKKKKVVEEGREDEPARWFINNTFPEVDQSKAREEALRYGGAFVMRHALERQYDQLQKEKEELEKKNKELQESLDEVVPTVKQLEQERASLGTKLGFEETKRKISESEREALAQELKLTKEAFLELKGNVQTLVHNGMKEHIGNFISSNSFDNIVNLYRLPTAIIAFTDCRKKVKTVYPEVDVTRITFGEQEAGVEEDGEMEEEEEAEVERGGVEAGADGAEVDKRQPAPEVEIHPVPSDDDQPPLPDEQQPRQPPLPAEEEPVEPPPPAEN